MANSIMLNVNPTFDIDVFARRLADTYAQKGYTVNAAKLGDSYSIVFDKGTGGINTVLGMGEGIKANVVLCGDTLTISFTDEEWTGKIIAFVIGWFLCWIPIITAAIGTIKQLELPKNIGNDATMIVASL